MNKIRFLLPNLVWLLPLLSFSQVDAAGVRDFTRSKPGTPVTATQASELTLTLTDVATRPIQNWIRTSGTVDKTGRILTTFIRSPEAELVQIGQRATAYTVNTRTRMNLGRITGITPKTGGALVEATLPVQVADNGARYLMEIVVERGPYLSIPNVSIIEEGTDHVVYLQKEPGRYTPTVIKTGLQGELYTQVTEGLKEGDQVVSVGSFFVDAETKLKSADAMMAAMPGMDHSAMAANVPPPKAGEAPAMVMTEPAANANVKAPLPMIHVMFNGPVDPKTSGFEVTKNGAPVDVGEAQPMGAQMLMAMPKTPLAAGSYKVKWHTVSASKKLEGEFSFTVQ